MIEFILYYTAEIAIVGIVIILIGLLLREIADSFKLKNLQIITFVIGSISSMIGAFLLLSLIMVHVVCSKEFTIMKIRAQKPNLKKEYLMKFDNMFLQDVLNELREKKLKEIQEKKEMKIQEIINS